MKAFLFAAALAALALGTTASSAADFTPDEIAKLPQDAVAAIKQDCADKWGNNFEMRIYCEDKQYEALQHVIARGEIKPNG
ncbi:hypothetical protein AS156_11190 [Bradyrhizobium macuxiense]|uniref:PepSY domain-containing protein n=1 Tax=Bradyrhizobium macuxiense TaxID=1755647 RepID=A0A120FLC4_9BRAD|nr:hypothetical protein [Bradyrhizobium macuxiense]KWV51979.1 hypothetical protein AS156_11190 [Bradyrhizobium macuxiense]